MAGDAGSNKVQNFATIVTTVLAVAAFIQSLSNRQQGTSTQTASRKSYGAVGSQIEQLGQTSEQQGAAIEKLWEAVSSIQSRAPAVANAEPAVAAEPEAAHHARRPQASPAAVAITPPPIPATAPAAAKPTAARLGALQLPRFVARKLPAYDDLEK
jgi:two-component system, chemotaxis family, sensor kinase CheA